MLFSGIFSRINDENRRVVVVRDDSRREMVGLPLVSPLYRCSEDCQKKSTRANSRRKFSENITYKIGLIAELA